MPVAFDDLSKVAQDLQPFELAEEHAGYVASGDSAALPEHELILAARDHDQYLTGEHLGGVYTVSRGFGIWDMRDGDEEMTYLEWSTEPKEGLEPMAKIDFDVTATTTPEGEQMALPVPTVEPTVIGTTYLVPCVRFKDDKGGLFGKSWIGRRLVSVCVRRVEVSLA